MMVKKWLLIITGFFLSGFLFGQKEKKYIRQGNNEYSREQFDESEIAYRKALEHDADSSNQYKASFNLGDALYKQEKLKEAINEFSMLAANQKNKEDLSKIYHNLGNAYLMSGEIENSIDAYKNALRNNPGDLETKYNLAYAQYLLKKQQEQQNQDQQNQQDQQQDQQNDQQQNQDQQQDMSKEDAEQMLQAIQNDENNVQEKLKKIQQNAVRVKIEKDW